MAALDFPSSPTTNQVYTAGGRSWTWDGTTWVGSPVPATVTVQSKTANYTILSGDGLVQGDASGGTFSLTLPAASGLVGQRVTLVKSDSSTTIITIARSASDTFEGWAGSQTALHLRLQYQSVTLQSDGSSKWRVVDRYTPEVSCLATASSTTTSTSGAETAVTLNTESWDTHTMHDLVTNNTRVVVPCSGRYRVRFRNRWAAGQTGTSTRDTFVRKNGTGSAWYLYNNCTSSATLQLMNEGSGLVDLVAADYLELTQGCGEAVTRANLALANLYPEFEVTLVEPLV